MSTSPFAPITLNGVSQYSSDFQKILTRAVQIAGIPVTLLQNQDANLLQQKSLIGGLNSAAGNLAASLSSLGTIAASQALAATSSNPTVVSANASGATQPASYTINSITSIASAASERTLTSYADSGLTPVSSTGKVKLVVGAQSFSFTLTKNSLTGVRDQINALGAGVTASILTTSTGNYLSVSANATGSTTLQLFDDPTGVNKNLLTSTNQGTNAVFALNGINVTQAGNTVNSVVPGLTFNILGTTSTPVTLSLASNGTQLSSGLQDFVSKYNALSSQILAQVGPNAGLLLGDTAVTQLQTTMRQLTSYTTTGGTVRSLSDLGVTFATNGQATFNQATFSSLSSTQISDGFKFLGSATKGLGGFSANLSQFSDPISGLIKSEEDGIDRSDHNIQRQITTLTDRINTMQANLAKQLAAADTHVALLQSQQQMLTASLTGLSLVLYGKTPGSV